MAVIKTDINNFLSLSAKFTVVDVRSPAEFEQAHIPGAHSLPLFSDEERKVVGTAYKQEGRERAIKIGLDYFGPKMVQMIEEMEGLCGHKEHGTRTLLVHCWRGGMRSAGVAWLLDLYGFKVYTLSGGYKAFRQWAHDQFKTACQLKIIGGYTGSGKTELLLQMKERGIPVIDLEGIANHKGSSFGSIGMPRQPSQEMFENLLALALGQVSSAAQPTTLWLEDESQRIGNVIIPASFWQQMRKAHVYFLQVPFNERLRYILKTYGEGEKEKIAEAIIRIRKRLGGLETKDAINHLQANNLEECFRILLTYYDKQYEKGMKSREDWQTLLTIIECEKVDAGENASKLLTVAKKDE